MAANGTESAPVEGITSIRVQGFKSLVDSGEVRIAPLTLLAGANSSGKSSLMQPLLLFKQTMEASFDPGGLLLDGSHVQFSSTGQFLSRVDPVGTFSVGVSVGPGQVFDWTFRRQGRTLQLWAIDYTQDPEFHITLYARMKSEDDLKERMRLLEHSEALKNKIIAEIVIDQLRSRASTNAEKPEPSREVQEAEIDEALSHVFAGRGIERRGLFLGFSTGPNSATIFPPTVGAAELAIRSILHIPGTRGTPTRAFLRTGTGPLFSGTFEPYIGSIVQNWRNSRDRRLNEVMYDMRLLGVAHRLVPRDADETRVELLVDLHPKRPKELVSIADVGFGVSQALPVLVALRAAAPGQLVYIEQPELHLHPRAQLAMATILVQAAKRGVRVVAETHSDLLLVGVQTAIAKGEITPGEVALHWFQRDAEGVSTVTTAEIDDAGTFGEWPEDFDDIALRAQGAYLDAAYEVKKRRLRG